MEVRLVWEEWCPGPRKSDEDFEAQREQVITRKWKRQDSESADYSSIPSFLAVMKSPQGLYKICLPKTLGCLRTGAQLKKMMSQRTPRLENHVYLSARPHR
ncbi:small integral membrane protein 17 isoform X5 [Mastomys coucha]|uniref:small integral membrane protein 17 isoform X5 n=1 Tax=Mastomys coucha TaxID=35658 RepID=UPI0012615C0D|nr:small integral membrane protein 17 isoform X5 [Mastomys coucha]